MTARRDPYDIVRGFFVDGPPASRNVAFEAYEDERFARAVRIYQYLVSVRDHLVELLGAEDEVQISAVQEDDRVVVRVRYQHGQLRRTAYLRPEEWRLLRLDPALGGKLPELRS